MEEYELKSNIETIKHLKKSVAWSDIKTIIGEWKEGCYKSLGDPNEVNTLESLADMQGRIYICEQVLNLPDMIMESIEQNNLNKEKEI